MIMEVEEEFLTKFGPSDFVKLVDTYKESYSDEEKPTGFDEKWAKVKYRLTDIRNTARGDLLEVSLRARQQCYALGMKNPPQRSRCWLCTLPFGEQNINTHPLQYAQCEHLLPSAIGFMLIGIPEGLNTMTPEVAQFLRANYSWAHAECNRIKRDSLFLEVIRTNNTINTSNVKIYSKVINQYLHTLWQTSSPNSPVGLHKAAETETESEWKSKAFFIISEQLTPLTMLLNRSTGINSLVTADRLLRNIDRISDKVIDIPAMKASNNTPKRTFVSPKNRNTTRRLSNLFTSKKKPVIANTPEDMRSPYKPRVRSEKRTLGGRKTRRNKK